MTRGLSNWLVGLLVGWIGLVAVTAAAWLAGPAASLPVESAPDTLLSGPGDIVLSDRCPPGFEQVPAGGCELRNLYQFYDSLQGRGVGGTRTALPAHRDGFTPEQLAYA